MLSKISIKKTIKQRPSSLYIDYLPIHYTPTDAQQRIIQYHTWKTTVNMSDIFIDRLSL